MDITNLGTAVLGVVTVAIPLLIKLRQQSAELRRSRITDQAELQKLQEGDQTFQRGAYQQIIADVQKNYNRLARQVEQLSEEYNQERTRLEERYKGEIADLIRKERDCQQENMQLRGRLDNPDETK